MIDDGYDIFQFDNKGHEYDKPYVNLEKLEKYIKFVTKVQTKRVKSNDTFFRRYTKFRRCGKDDFKKKGRKITDMYQDEIISK